MQILNRLCDKLPPEKMVNVNITYLRAIIKASDISLPIISMKMGYCPEYLGNCIGCGRICIDYLIMLSEIYKFPYKDAIVKKPKRRKR